MSKKLRYDMAYDAPTETVAAMLADPAFRERVCQAQRVLRQDVSITPAVAGGPMVVRIEVVHATTGVPGFATKFVGSETSVIQAETWTSPEHGDIVVEIPGKPGTIAGTAVLTSSGATTTETVTLDIKVSLPLIGGKLESLISDLMLKALKAEYRTGQAYLAEGPTED